jgi:hypothetical protein
MLQKIVIGLMVFTVLGAGGAAIAYNAGTQDTNPAAAAIEPLGDGSPTVASQQVAQNEVVTTSQPIAQGAQGKPWQAAGLIAAVDDYGFDFTLDSGESVYIELGPPDFWRYQGVEITAGQAATVFGTLNEGTIHASRVELEAGQVLTVRNETGQPLWSGGVSNGQNGNAGGDHIPDPQAQVDEWITLEGELISFQGGNMTMGTSDEELIAFQTGQPRFFSGQGITFQVGDPIRVLGFYQGDQFMAGEITQISSGLKVMLRDPNGRPLWAGPGSGGNGGAGGNGGNGGSGFGGNGSGNRRGQG